MKTPPLVLALLARVGGVLRRWRSHPEHTFPVERPPRSRRPGNRTRVLWNANQIHPYAFTIDEPDHDHYWRD